ncbi:glycosyltransferase BC10-like isoform X2 [Impatiens glandulifera]|uniref:glycosyltransferase BC10-like isoform X2 n=1 Tax=Impatiens glandulifera TaxID=253017 RepID=UPI001FB052F7|nr:glycosyltransferase BC10-like isoform X2 [Impatiens glandulifera]
MMVMKKSSSSFFSSRRVLWFGWKLVIALSVSLCLMALIRLRQYSQPETSSSSSYRLSRSRSRIHSPHLEDSAKIAFLFLARRDLPLDFLWGDFFENADAAHFSIYIHSEPGFVFDDSTTRSSFFYNRQLTNTIKVSWGEASMIQAERLLLDAALEDPANQRFVLLSDSCVPLYNFTYVYSYLMSSSSKSFVDSFHDKKEGRYNPKMSNVIPRNKWRKGSQWFTLTKRHAEVVVDDDVVFPAFKKFCRRRPAVDPSKGKENIVKTSEAA